MSSPPPVPVIMPPLPPGFVFRPTDQQMVSMLKSLVAGAVGLADDDRLMGLTDDAGGIIIPGSQPPRFLDISLYAPEDLPSYKKMYGYHVSYFYTSVANGVHHGAHLTRLTLHGTWKWIVEENPIEETEDGGPIVGYKKKFVYYYGKKPNEEQSNWIMEEVRMNPDLMEHSHLDKEKMGSMVMCKVYNLEDCEDAETGSDFEELVARTLDRELGSSSPDV